MKTPKKNYNAVAWRSRKGELGKKGNLCTKSLRLALATQTFTFCQKNIYHFTAKLVEFKVFYPYSGSKNGAKSFEMTQNVHPIC